MLQYKNIFFAKIIPIKAIIFSIFYNYSTGIKIFQMKTPELYVQQFILIFEKPTFEPQFVNQSSEHHE